MMNFMLRVQKYSKNIIFSYYWILVDFETTETIIYGFYEIASKFKYSMEKTNLLKRGWTFPIHPRTKRWMFKTQLLRVQI